MADVPAQNSLNMPQVVQNFRCRLTADRLNQSMIALFSVISAYMGFDGQDHSVDGKMITKNEQFVEWLSLFNREKDACQLKIDEVICHNSLINLIQSTLFGDAQLFLTRIERESEGTPDYTPAIIITKLKGRYQDNKVSSMIADHTKLFSDFNVEFDPTKPIEQGAWDKWLQRDPSSL